MITPVDFSRAVMVIAVVLVGLVALILLSLAWTTARNPILTRLGVRNIPRRPAQTVLIVLGLTLSTIIIISSLSIGNTLSYSVRRQAVDAYGAIDEVLAPPLLATLTELVQAEGDGSPDLSAIEGALRGDVQSILTLFRAPSIAEADYFALRDKVGDDPLIDGLAPAIVLPTIIRNTATGQGEPLGFIFAVDDAYSEQFGLATIAGEPARLDALGTGVGNIFQVALDLFELVADSPVISAASRALAGLGAGLAALGGTEGLSLDLSQLDPATQVALGAVLGQITGRPEDVDVGKLVDDLLSPQLLSAVNLNTLRRDIDAALAQAGLQLRQGDIYLNQIGAEKLGARPGDVLEIYIGPLPIPYRVKEIVRESGPMGALTPVVLMRLDEAQKLYFMQDRINSVLVSNRGDALSGLAYTAAVSKRLRALALDDASVARVAALLRQPAVRARLAAAIAEEQTARTAGAGPLEAGAARGPRRRLEAFADFLQGSRSTTPWPEALTTLARELDQPGISADLRRTLADSRVTTWLTDLSLEPAPQAELEQLITEMNKVALIAPLTKESVVQAAEAGSTIFMAIFAVFGTFSILAGILLIFMIFVMLAAERRSELGTARALGMQRAQLVRMFVAEGIVYDLLAAAVGVALGLGVSYAIAGFIGQLFSDVAGQVSGQSTLLRIRYYTAPTSIVIAYCLGVLLTFIVVNAAARHVGRLNIVAAIRDLPDEAHSPARLTWRGRLWRFGSLALAALLAVGVVAGGLIRQGQFDQVGASAALLALAALLGRLLLRFTEWRAERRECLVYSLIGMGLIAIWSLPIRLDAPTVAPVGEWAPLVAVVAFGLSGPLLAIGAVLLVIYNADLILRLFSRALSRVASLAPVLRMAVAYPLSARTRTGLTMLMFAIVVTVVVLMAVVIAATQALITPDTQANAGFEIIVSPTLLSFFNPVHDLKARLLERPDAPLAQIERIAQLGEVAVEARLASADPWSPARITGVNDDYLAQAARFYRFRQRAAGFADDLAVWEALRARPDVAIVSAGMLAAPPADGAEEPEEMALPRHYLRISGVDPAAPTLPPLTITVRMTAQPGLLAALGSLAARQPPTTTQASQAATPTLQIIAVLEPGPNLAGPGIQVGPAAFASITGAPLAADRFYVKIKTGADAGAVARQLERSLVDSALDAVVVAEMFAAGQKATRGILQLFQGFMALGLLVGIAALGVISSRTVVERRQQIGMMRAIGMPARLVALAFLLEASFISLWGIVIGAAAGTWLGQRVVISFFSDLGMGTPWQVPWLTIGSLMALTYLASLATTLLPAYQASRVYPAEALRYE